MVEMMLVAIIKPKPGKIDRVIQLLMETAAKVKESEPYVLQYSCYKEANPKDGLQDIVMMEKYISQEDQDRHMRVPHVLGLLATWEKESLLRDELYVKNIEFVGGY